MKITQIQQSQSSSSHGDGLARCNTKTEYRPSNHNPSEATSFNQSYRLPPLLSTLSDTSLDNHLHSQPLSTPFIPAFHRDLNQNFDPSTVFPRSYMPPTEPAFQIQVIDDHHQSGSCANTVPSGILSNRQLPPASINNTAESSSTTQSISLPPIQIPCTAWPP